ncbi:MAG: PKD domain-containing protein [Gammaproteobacteria bacterium]|nr:PKD domain-containing protein [Gammaproteobacteria bacterium]
MRYPGSRFIALVLCVMLLVLIGCENSFPTEIAENSSVPDGNGVDVDAPGGENTDKPTEVPDSYIKPRLLDVAGTTEKISVSSDGVFGDGNSISAAISVTGRYVVFESIASTLTDNDNNSAWDIFLRDRETRITQRLSLSVDGNDADDASLEPAISDDGRIIVFTSTATNLVENDLNGSSDIFVYNAVDSSLQRISIDSAGLGVVGDNRLPDVSGNGRFVVFESTAMSLVAGDNNQAVDVFLHDRVTHTTQRVSVGNLNEEANGGSYKPAVSDNGRFVIFSSDADNLVANDSNGVRDIFVRDLQENTTRRLSVSSAGVEANAGSGSPDISGNGVVAIFQSEATNLVLDDTNTVRDIFSYNLLNNHTERMSVSSLGGEANASTFTVSAITFDGRYVVFYSAASNLVANDVNAAWDVFVHDRTDKQTKIMSVSNNNGVAGNASSFEPSISANGHYVVFGSAAANLTSADTNGFWDIFLHVLVTANVAPIADAGTDQSVILGETVQLDGANSFDPDANDGVAGGLQYQWQFESTPTGSGVVLDGGDMATPRFVPDLPGAYLVSLVVSDAEHESIADAVLINVVENLDPIAAIGVQVVSGNTPLRVNFDASGSIDPEGGGLTVHWNFGDPESEQDTSSTSLTEYTYEQPGEYIVVLTVTDPSGNVDKASVTIRALASNNPPIVNPTATPVSGVAPLTVSFIANAVDPDNDALDVIWDFGDGVSSNQSSPFHVYTKPGVYKALVTVIDTAFRTQAEITIVVNPTLQFITQKAVVVLNNKHDDKDKLLFKAMFEADGVPAQDDYIRFVVDDIVLLETPFSSFKKSGKTKKGVYRYTQKHEFALLDLANGTFKYFRHKVMLGGISYSNGTSVRFSVGERLATESIMMRKVNRYSDKKKDDEADYFTKKARSSNVVLIYHRRGIPDLQKRNRKKRDKKADEHEKEERKYSEKTVSGDKEGD